MSLVQVIYTSLATEKFAEHDIPGLIDQARQANSKRNMTGMLLFVEGVFVQALEGHAPLVDAVYALISRDRRHENLRRCLRAPLSERVFAGQSMGFAALDFAEAAHLSGEKNPGHGASCHDASWLQTLDPTRAYQLVRAFGSECRRLGEVRARQAVG